MPPSRRRPNPSAGQQPPVRRPRVAGLRNRPTTTSATPLEDTEEQVPVQERTTDSAIDDGVVNGVLGETAPTEDTTQPEDTVEDEPAAEPEDEAADSEVETDADELAEDEAEPTPTRTRHRRGSSATSRPTGKRRSSGVTRPTTREDAPAPRAKQADSDAPRRQSLLANRLNVAILLAVIAAVLAGLAFWFRAEANSLGAGESNTALTDTGATTAAVGQLTTIIETTFSYNYTDLAATEKAVKAGIASKASCEYRKLFKVVLDNAPTQQLILTTEVRNLRLERLEGDRATALAFIDQTTIKVGAEPLGGGGMLGITAQRIDGRWKIVEFDTFNKTLPNGQEAPSC